MGVATTDLFGLWILEPAPKDSEQHNGPKK